jgi:hypothetical protein
MKLDVRERVLTVAMAEAACLQAHVARLDAINKIKRETLRVATPWRIIGSGFSLGAVIGLMPVKTKTKTVGPIGQLLSMATETILPSLMAGLTAGQVAGEEVEHAASDVADEVADQVSVQVADQVVAEVSRPGGTDDRGPA